MIKSTIIETKYVYVEKKQVYVCVTKNQTRTEETGVEEEEAAAATSLEVAAPFRKDNNPVLPGSCSSRN
ncbi:unnamed protein product [Cochlearia groenlandica]